MVQCAEKRKSFDAWTLRIPRPAPVATARWPGNHYFARSYGTARLVSAGVSRGLTIAGTNDATGYRQSGGAGGRRLADASRRSGAVAAEGEQRLAEEQRRAGAGPGACGLASRCTPTLVRNSLSRASKATSSNPLAWNQERIWPVRSGGRRCRVQITVAPGAHMPDAASTVRLMSASADVAEDAGQQEHVSGQRVGEVRHHARIRLPDSHRRESGGACPLPCHGGVLAVGLDQQRGHVGPAWVVRKHLEHVAPLPGAQAEQLNRPRRRLIQRPRQMPGDPVESRPERRGRVVVAAMPGHPVLHVPILPGPPAPWQRG